MSRDKPLDSAKKKERKSLDVILKILQTPFYSETKLLELLERLKKQYDKEVLNNTLKIIHNQKYTFEEIDRILDNHYKCHGLDARMEIENINFNLVRLQLMGMIDSDIYEIQNLFLNQLFNKNITFLESLELIAYLSKESVLEYFGIRIDD